MRYLLVFLCLLVMPFDTNAQFGDIGQTGVTLATQPRIPEPFTETTIEMTAFSFDTVGSSITWLIDGVEDVSARNQRVITLTTKALGEATEITNIMRLRSGVEIITTETIIPARVDIVLEAETLVPAFYKGRPLPSIGSTVRAIAIPQTNNNAAPAAYSYEWRLGNEVLFNGPITGINVAEFEIGLNKNETLAVSVTDRSGVLVAHKTIVIPVTEPEVVFYEENPLRGVTGIALPSPYYLVGEETTVRAEPFYMSSNIFSANPLIEWEIDGRTVTNPSTDPQYLTLRKTGGIGSARVSFHIRNLQQLVQGVEDRFVIQF